MWRRVSRYLMERWMMCRDTAASADTLMTTGHSGRGTCSVRERQATHVFLWPGLDLAQSTKREGDQIFITREGHSTLLLYILKIIFNNNNQ